MFCTKDVIISVVGCQKYEGQTSEQVKLVTDGTMSCNDEGIYSISYAESEITGLEGTVTTFDVAPHCITMTRSGALNSQMVFEEGHTHESLYDMGFGALLIGVRARKVESELNEQGGTFHMEYIIKIENDVSGVNEYDVTIREAQ